MNNYIISPFDVVMFGESSPFDSVDQTYRKSSTILNPIPLFACLKKRKKDIRINFISLINNDQILFPVPFDVVEINKKIKFGELRHEKMKFLSKSNDEYFVTFGSGKVNTIDERTFVDSVWLEKYLMDDKTLLVNKEGTIRGYKAYDFEPRTGVKIDYTKKTSEHGYLYVENYLRFTDKTGFYSKNTLDIENETYTLGGESRVVQVQKTEKDIDKEFVNQNKIIEKIKQTRLFKIVLLTPTNGICEISGAKLVAKIVRRPYIYSGWLRNNNKYFPSRLFKLIRPGAVFYYRIETYNIDDFITKLFENFWLKPAFFAPDFPYFESVENVSSICLGLSIIGATKEVDDE